MLSKLHGIEPVVDFQWPVSAKIERLRIWYFIASDWLLHFSEALAGELDFEEALQRASQMTRGEVLAVVQGKRKLFTQRI